MMAKPVTHTVDNLEAGQRDSIRRAAARAAGASREELAELPSDSDVNRAEAQRLAEARGDSTEDDPSEESPQTTRRGPAPSDQPEAEAEAEES